MNKTFTSSEVREFVAQWREHALTVSEKFAVMAMISAYADRLEADEKTQAQRGIWVLVPREPTDGMLQAAEDAVDAASNCESTTDDLSAIAYKAALAAAPQPQTERLAETLPSDAWFANEICEARNHWHEHHEANWLETDDNHPDDFMGKWLRSKLLATHDTHPQPAQDAKDASRYRWLADSEDGDLFMENPGKELLDRAIDAAMAGESGR